MPKKRRFDFTKKNKRSGKVENVGYLDLEQDEEQSRCSLYFYGDIVSATWESMWYEEDRCPQDIADFLNQLDGYEDIDIYFNSGGGDVFAGLAIYNQLKRYDGHKVGYVDGMAASIASVIMFACDELHFATGAQAMIHKASNYDPAQITIACEADCSSGVAAIVKGAGYRLGNEKMKNVSIYLYTGNMRAGLKAAGFEVLTDSKYLTSDAYLLEGDITLNDNAHVAVNLTDGAKSSGTGASNTTTVKSNAKVDVAHGFNKSLAGTYKVTASGLNLRAGAGTGKSILAVMKNGEKVQCYGYYNDCNGVKWLYVVYKNIVGYASSKYLSK